MGRDMMRQPSEFSRLPRRAFLSVTGTAAAAAALGHCWPTLAQSTNAPLSPEEAAAPELTPDAHAPALTVRLQEADGTPLAAERARTLLVCDLAGDPLPQAISFSEGCARVALAKEPIQVGVRLKVPGFGEVYCYADNQGRGYRQPQEINFAPEAAITRLQRVRQAVTEAGPGVFQSEPAFGENLEAAAAHVASQPVRPPEAYASLGHSLRAGELLVLKLARDRISRLPQPRTGFLFGALGSGWQRGGEWEKAFLKAFNFAPSSWYTWSKNPEPAAQRIDYTRMDQSVGWCLAHRIAPKAFGYVYLTNGATPEWLRTWPYEQVLPEYKRVVEQTLRRFAGRVPYVEVINEAHDKANLFHFSHQQVLELTREACLAARRGAPTVKRLINHCCLWAEYARRANPGGVRRWSPFLYLQDCVRAGVEFETVGLQLYYPQHDLFEIDRKLNRFKALNRPIHITELSCNSAEGLDPASMRPKSYVPGWHGPWTESMQADWLEAIYTLCYSKPEIEAVGWWDLADTGGHFWPHGGLLHKDLTPKESYHRLLQLQAKWGVEKT
jgi:endo-1,4-beta-xylanase